MVLLHLGLSSFFLYLVLPRNTFISSISFAFPPPPPGTGAVMLLPSSPLSYCCCRMTLHLLLQLQGFITSFNCRNLPLDRIQFIPVSKTLALDPSL
uniref:Uncharacterized protein n=1 Tax=Octopus bimaculoides TaxID=37653 RepID=A0A0L8HZJ7_OCTBM